MDRNLSVRCPRCKEYFDIFVDAFGAHVVADVPEGQDGARGQPTGPQGYGDRSQNDKSLEKYTSKSQGGRLLQENAEQHKDAKYPPNMPANRRRDD
jgi:hypothetical protein